MICTKSHSLWCKEYYDNITILPTYDITGQCSNENFATLTKTTSLKQIIKYNPIINPRNTMILLNMAANQQKIIVL